MACRMALNNTSSLNGLVRNSTAPAFMARTVIGTSPYPVMKMMGMSVRAMKAGAELPGGRERLRLPAREADQQFQRFAHRDVVVDDEHDRHRMRHGLGHR